MKIVEYDVRDRIGYITLNRPEKRNALSPELIAGLHDAFKIADADPAVKVVVLKANGEAFCAGADLSYLQQLQKFSYEENLEDSRKLKELFLMIYSMKKIVVAQIQGHALAGGCGLTTICDFAFAVPEASFGYTEVKIGFIPAIVMVFLLRKIGGSWARELLLTGSLITAERAKEMGLIYQVTSKENLEAEVNKFAMKFVQNTSSQSIAATKKMFTTVPHLSLEEALETACKENATARATEDCKRGIEAFLKKEDLKW